jgi:hypothetical protein
LHAELSRELSLEDLGLLETDLGSKPAPIARIRDSHHALARVMAGGVSNAEASAITGYSPSRISILKSDPTFKELLEFYRERTEAVFIDVVERLKLLSLDAVQELSDRLHDAGATIKTGDLIEIAKFGADRSGHGPLTKHLEANLVLSAEDLNLMKEIMQESHETHIGLEARQRALSVSEGGELGVGGVNGGAQEEVLSPERVESSGPGVRTPLRTGTEENGAGGGA